MLFTNVWQILPFEPLIKQFGKFFSDENLPSSVGPFALSLFTDYPNSSSFNNCSLIFEIYEHYQTHFSSHVYITTIPLLNTPPPFLYLFGEVLIKVELGPKNNNFLVLVLVHLTGEGSPSPFYESRGIIFDRICYKGDLFFLKFMVMFVESVCL